MEMIFNTENRPGVDLKFTKQNHLSKVYVHHTKYPFENSIYCGFHEHLY